MFTGRREGGVIYMPKKYRIAIIALSVLLAVSALSLTATLIYNASHPSGPAKAVVPDNLITPDPDNKQDATGQLYRANSVVSITHTNVSLANAADLTAGIYSVIAAAETATSAAADKTNSDTYADVLYLHRKNPGDNEPFAVDNMFPGDTETKYYCVRAAHSGDITVRYHADIREGYEKLAEVLMCRVELLTTGEVLYDGLMRDMPLSLDHPIKANEQTESELYYRIDAYLETSVGNDYQNKTLIADFRWWVEETGSLIPPPKTGDLPVLPYAITASVSFFFLILLLKKNKKEDADNA